MRRTIGHLRRNARFIVAAIVALVGIELLGAWSAPPRTVQASYNEAMLGRAVFPGAVIGDVRYGVTFSGMAEGELSGLWAVTVNYTPGSADGGVINTILGGRWQSTWFEGGIYRGTLYGEVTGGQIVRDATGVTADVSVDFLVLGGTGAYAGARGTGRLIEGHADHAPFPPTLTGRIALRLDRGVTAGGSE